MSEVLKWLPLLVVVISTSVAFGVQQQRISSVEQAVQAQVQQQEAIVTVKENVAAGRARQEIILEQIREHQFPMISEHNIWICL